MMPRKIFSRIKEQYLRGYHSHNTRIRLDNPIISFTFDDFPVTAYKSAGAILEYYGVRGTYYASVGLMGHTTADMGKHFTSKDIPEMLEKGHEIGCHTYSHLVPKHTMLDEYITDTQRNREALTEFTGETEQLNFSFPFGHTTPKIKQAIADNYKTCRGIFPGINNGITDLNLLRANRLYSNSISIKEQFDLININKISRGWLIFYTHDVESSPSSWGCTQEYFSDVVRNAIDSGAEILTINEACNRIL